MTDMGGRGSGRQLDPKQEFYVLDVSRQLAQEAGARNAARGMAARQRQIVAQNKAAAKAEKAAKAERAKKAKRGKK